MSTIRVVCPSCKSALGVPADSAGKRVRCPKCQIVMGVPGTVPAAAPRVTTPAAAASAPFKPANNPPPPPAKPPLHVASRQHPAFNQLPRPTGSRGLPGGLAGVLGSLLVLGGIVGGLWYAGYLDELISPQMLQAENPPKSDVKEKGDPEQKDDAPKKKNLPKRVTNAINEKDPFSLQKIRLFPEGDWTLDIVVVSRQESTTQLTDLKGNPLTLDPGTGKLVPGKDPGQGVEVVQDWEHSTLKVLEAGDTAPKRYQKMFHEVGKRARGLEYPEEHHGKAVEFVLGEDEMRFEGRKPPDLIVVTLKVLERNENDLTPALLKALTSPDPVLLKGTWNADIDALDRVIREGGKDSFSVVKDKNSKVEGRFLGWENKDGKRCVALEWKLRLVMKVSDDTKTALKLVELPVYEATITLHTLPDGSSTWARYKMVSKMTMKAQSPLGPSDESILMTTATLDRTMERSAEGEKLIFRLPPPPK